MDPFDGLLDRMEELIAGIELLDESVQGRVWELLDGIDSLHRMALSRLADVLGPDAVQELRSESEIKWMFDAYGIGVDEMAAADHALETIRPYIHSHGGSVEIVDAANGVVRVKMLGACSGCTASAITLQQGVEEALREHFPAFVLLEVEDDNAPSHPPPGPTLLQIEMPPSHH